MTHPQQPYGPPIPGYGPPAPEPPKKKRTGLKITLGVLGGLVVLGVIGSALGDGGSSKASDDGRASVKPNHSPQQSEAPEAEQATEQQEAPPVTMTAKAVDYTPGMLGESGAKYTAVQVVITNGSEKKISVNPMYFNGLDSESFKHNAAMGTGADGELHHADLQPGEKAKGLVVFKGDVKITKVEFNDSLIGTTYSAAVK